MPVRIAVLGCAAIAARSMGPALRADPDVDLVAVASRTTDRARELAARLGCEAVTGYQRVLDRDDVDAVYVPLPTGLHQTWVRAALTAGKHVLVEKSLTTDLHRARELVGLARARGLALAENLMFRHHGQHRLVRRLLDEGAIGGLRAFAAEFAIPPRPAGDIRYDPGLGGGALLDTGAYTVAAASLHLGGGLEVAGAFAGIDPVLGVDVRGSALLAGPDGVPAQLSYGFDHSYACEYSLWGTSGRLRLQRAFTPPADLVPRVELLRGGDRTEISGEPDDHFAGAVRHFAGLVTGRMDRYTEYRTLLDQSSLLDRIREVAAIRELPTPLRPADG